MAAASNSSDSRNDCGSRSDSSTSVVVLVVAVVAAGVVVEEAAASKSNSCCCCCYCYFLLLHGGQTLKLLRQPVFLIQFLVKNCSWHTTCQNQVRTTVNSRSPPTLRTESSQLKTEGAEVVQTKPPKYVLSFSPYVIVFALFLNVTRRRIRLLVRLLRAPCRDDWREVGEPSSYKHKRTSPTVSFACRS